MNGLKDFAIFGDSWPYGVDLNSEEIPFGKILATKLNFNYHCYAEPGTSIEHMILQLHRCLSKQKGHNTVALFCLTESSRSLYFDPTPQTTSVMWNGPDPSDIVSTNYYKYIHSDKLDYFRLHQSVVTLQTICKEFKIQDYYVSSFAPINWDIISLRGLNRTKFYKQGTETFLDFFGCDFVDPNNEYFLGSASTHPNQKGHELIAEKLLPWINYQ